MVVTLSCFAEKKIIEIRSSFLHLALPFSLIAPSLSLTLRRFHKKENLESNLLLTAESLLGDLLLPVEETTVYPQGEHMFT